MGWKMAEEASAQTSKQVAKEAVAAAERPATTCSTCGGKDGWEGCTFTKAQKLKEAAARRCTQCVTQAEAVEHAAAEARKQKRSYECAAVQRLATKRQRLDTQLEDAPRAWKIWGNASSQMPLMPVLTPQMQSHILPQMLPHALAHMQPQMPPQDQPQMPPHLPSYMLPHPHMPHPWGCDELMDVRASSAEPQMPPHMLPYTHFTPCGTLVQQQQQQQQQQQEQQYLQYLQYQ